jgi:hypothetical protein
VRYKVALCTTKESILLRQLLESLERIDLYTYEQGALVTTDAAQAGGGAPRIDVWVVEGDAASGIDPGAGYLFIDTLEHPFLPVVPATRELVDAMLDAGSLKPDTVIASMPSRKVSVTAEKVAINAVMAGCKPDCMPVVATAVKCLATPEFGLHHVASALSGPTIVVVVNGPIAIRLGINATNNVFGPGVRANATIGRALRLVLLNCLKYRPGVSDRATMGTPGKYTCCIAENEENHPGSRGT